MIKLKSFLEPETAHYMSLNFIVIYILVVIIISGCIREGRPLAGLAENSVLIPVKNGKGWGLRIEQGGKVVFSQINPVYVAIYKDSLPDLISETSYNRIRTSGKMITGSATISPVTGVKFEVTDNWQLLDSALVCNRKVIVKGNDKGGFLTSIRFMAASSYQRKQADIFVPGMVYGGTDNLTDGSIGGRKNFPNGYGNAFIREDRMPAPLFGLFFNDGLRITILNPKPDGRTSLADARGNTIKTLVDSSFHFGSIGVSISPDTFLLGYNYPGSEGDITYARRPDPVRQKNQWRRRYHPVSDGFEQNYTVAFRFSGETSFPEFYHNSWLWAWKILKPKVNHHDIPLVERSMIDMLAEQVMEKDGRSGIPTWKIAKANEPFLPDRKAIMGFVGKNIEASYLLILDGESDTPLSKEHRRKALDIINSFIRLKMSPPAGEGFYLDTGLPALALPRDKKVYLRSFCEDMKTLLRTIEYEKEYGREHPEWLAWVKSFADWLLPQQRPDGGFPRSWKPVTGEVIDSSELSSYNAVPMLVRLTGLTGNQVYLKAAESAAEYCWDQYMAKGYFVGGTIDNPNVIDKEAGTLSTEAYLSMHKATGSKVWLDRAIAAANYAETWIYIWDIPMVDSENNTELEWKKGVPTTGVQGISTGGSGVDEWMAYDTDDYAFLYKATGERHFFDVAKILLHNTKSMMAIPGRLYDLRGPGWQQEHWSLAPVRGFGSYRIWLPWVTTCQLRGIEDLKQLDQKLYEELCKE